MPKAGQVCLQALCLVACEGGSTIGQPVEDPASRISSTAALSDPDLPELVSADDPPCAMVFLLMISLTLSHKVPVTTFLSYMTFDLPEQLGTVAYFGPWDFSNLFPFFAF